MTPLELHIDELLPHCDWAGMSPSGTNRTSRADLAMSVDLGKTGSGWRPLSVRTGRWANKKMALDLNQSEDPIFLSAE
jgi:hypothetical protein